MNLNLNKRHTALLAAMMFSAAPLVGCGGSDDVVQPVAPKASVSAVSFKDMPADAGSIQSVTVTNTDSTAKAFNVAVTSTSQTGAFHVIDNSCASSVPAGQTCAISVVFFPAATLTSYSANLAISPLDEPTAVTTVALTGNTTSEAQPIQTCAAGLVYVSSWGVCLIAG
ncbi:hypothetical protein [Scleromatobacter humisilvae]|uniref:Abnormal spindle-like microcephaly-associated protein ASH domain-containing protein n=1 Tax=Scleromatobacter humisilvae TaxID=2897159 RepID=A0A9X2C3D7_9BURK|nr:hypothetical protein [Scleromatobacter humisilvae]MCK9687305.1 hypothetical protein [Scleromatobacter humisilvae]